jgi:hypothetical protein
MKFEQPQPQSESPHTKYIPDFAAKAKKNYEEMKRKEEEPRRKEEEQRMLKAEELRRKGEERADRRREEVMKLGKLMPLEVDVNVKPKLEDEDRPSGVRGEPVVPPIESGPVTVRSGVGPDQYGMESAPSEEDLDIPLSAEEPESHVRYIGGEISGKRMKEAEQGEVAYAEREELPPSAPSVIEEEEEEEERREAA